MDWFGALILIIVLFSGLYLLQPSCTDPPPKKEKDVTGGDAVVDLLDISTEKHLSRDIGNSIGGSVSDLDYDRFRISKISVIEPPHILGTGIVWEATNENRVWTDNSGILYDRDLGPPLL